MIKLGVCTSVENAKMAYDAGFDYIECGFGGTMSLPRAEFDAWKKLMLEQPIRCEVMNGMLPGHYRLTGANAALEPVKEFLKVAFERAGEIELDVVVFGSGGARNIPVDENGDLLWPMDKSLNQLVEYLTMAGELAQMHGVTIAIEPLRTKECNIIQRVSEGAELARRVNHPNVMLLADGFHMAEMNESPESIVAAGSLMRHCHTANPDGRCYPTPSDKWDYAPFFDALKKIGYCGRVSVEAGFKDFAFDAPLAFKTLDVLR